MSKYKFMTGTVIIVGKKTKKSNKFKVDAIVTYDSFCLARKNSNFNIYLLQHKDKSKIKLLGRVYICGHGNEKKQTISDYNITEIANELNHNFILNNCDIRIMSCYGKVKNSNGKDMADLLLSNLKQLGCSNIKVQAVAEGTTIIVPDKTKNTAVVVDEKLESYTFYAIQAWEQLCSICLPVNLNINKNYQKKLRWYYIWIQFMNKVPCHNKKYIKRM